MRKAALAVLVVLSPLGATGAARADDTIATVARPAPVSAYAGRVAWSAHDPARGYVLMTRFAGVTSEVPVAPRSVPFDVDLGPGGSGVVAAYSRCRHDPPAREPGTGNALTQLPRWAAGRGCDIYRFDFGSGRERKLRSVSSPRASEFLPSIWQDRIAFARTYERRRGRAGQRPYLYLARIGPSGHTRRLPAGSRSTQKFCTGKPLRCVRRVENGPTALDLSGRGLAFGWDSGGQGDPTTALYLDTTRAGKTRRKRLDFGSSGDIQGEEVVSPTIDSGHVWWGFIQFGDVTANWLRRYSISSGERDQAQIPAPPATDAFLHPVLWTSVSASDVFYLLSGLTIPGEPCTVQLPCNGDPGCSAAGPCPIRDTRDLTFLPLGKAVSRR